MGAEKLCISGNSDVRDIPTSYVERANLTTRINIRRFIRLTNAFSKKVENHPTALGLFFIHYNLCRINKTLRVTPAMAAKVTSRMWSIAELVALLPDTSFGKKRGHTRSGRRAGFQSRTLRRVGITLRG